METAAVHSLYPLHRCKTVHLVRHGQGFHNVSGEKNHKAYLSEDFFDANLTPLGWKQVTNLRKHINASGLASRIDLVVTSPLLRTIQTAVGVVGGPEFMEGEEKPPLMISNAGDSDQAAISSLNCPPFIAAELCREHLGVHPCDRRRRISEHQTSFPAIDFSLIENDDDVLWKPDYRETNEEVATRGRKFIDWLMTREEKEIAVVTHSSFLVHTLRMFGHDCRSVVKEEISKSFANCELRSLVIVDKCAAMSHYHNTSFPGKVPGGPDEPSDFVHMNKSDEDGVNSI